jgi:P27 family predicted phage terminase small subunit
MTTKKPPAPRDLGARGRAFWRQAMDTYELSEVETELLKECCRLLDECETLRESVDSEGTTVKGSTGQFRVHPALGEVRQHRLALGKLLAQLDLPDESGEALLSPVQARAKRAADARWGRRGTA